MDKTSKIGVPFKVRFFLRISLRIWHKNKSKTKNLKLFSHYIHKYFPHFSMKVSSVIKVMGHRVSILQGFLLFKKAFDLLQSGNCKLHVDFWFQCRRDLTEFVLWLSLPLFRLFFSKLFLCITCHVWRSKTFSKHSISVIPVWKKPTFIILSNLRAFLTKKGSKIYDLKIKKFLRKILKETAP